ncbi:hypothetical protein FB451DRAFT_1552853 [Mycena latifolia]|nr:hypothetical protein FB451DRAFT_1552853 [Mycena latifolia]
MILSKSIMAISAADIIAYVIPEYEANTPGISDEVRDRLEWTWGLGHNRLDEHLSNFADPQPVLTDDAVLVIPHTDIINTISARNWRAKSGIIRPYIQKLYKGRRSFEYLVVPIDPDSPVPARILVSEIPPHLALCTTAGKVMKIWGYLTGAAYAAVRASLIERSKVAIDSSRPALSTTDLDTIHSVYRIWSFVDYVPPSFLSEDWDQTMVEAEDSPDAKSASESASGSSSGSSMDWEVGSSASCEHEPRRRLLPSELQQDVNARPSTDGDDEDALSSNSHITGVEDPAKASIERKDCEVDRAWLKGITHWAEGAEAVGDEEMLLNDDQIKEDPREQPRDATSVDLNRPAYLSRRKIRTAT